MPDFYMKIIFLSFLLLFTISISKYSYASNVEISPGLYHFNYEEFSTTDISLNNEVGILSGLELKSVFSIANLEYHAYLAYYSGRVDYRGYTQGGVQHNTRTDETIFQLGLDIYSPLEGEKLVKLQFGVRYWNWDRDILTKGNVLGLHEIYSWSEINLGLLYQSKPIDHSFYSLSASVLHTLNPSIEIDLGSSSLNLKLGKKPGFRAYIGKTWLKDKNQQLSLTLTTEYWSFGRSNTGFTNNFFGNAAFITEPRSESFHTALNLSFRYSF